MNFLHCLVLELLEELCLDWISCCCNLKFLFFMPMNTIKVLSPDYPMWCEREAEGGGGVVGTHL